MGIAEASDGAVAPSRVKSDHKVAMAPFVRPFDLDPVTQVP
jgi:hypothetical protein